MALKDIKNDLGLNGGLKRPLGSLKRKMSESGCQSTVQCKSRIIKDDLEKDIESGITGSRSVRNMDVLKSNHCIVSPVVVKENLPPVPLEIQLTSPNCSPASSILSISNRSLSYFADPTGPSDNGEQESAEISINGDKYFSTPMPSKGRVKRKLTPVIEVDVESNISEEWQHEVLSKGQLSKNSADVSLHGSPTETPLYRSFFAAECLEIVNQIKNVEPDVRSPSKPKVEEFDVSTIDAEPLPFDSTPMKSMLACEVAQVLRSLENSPVKEGVSLFGESLLDLSQMQLNDFNLSECDLKTDKGCFVSDSDGLDGGCLKRQKIEPLKEIYQGKIPVNQVNKMPLLPKTLEKFTPEILVDSSHGHTTTIGEGIAGDFPNDVNHPKFKFSDNVVEPYVLIKDMSDPHSVSQVIESSPTALVNNTRSPAHEVKNTLTCKQLGETEENKMCANTTTDIVFHYDELPPAETTRVIEESQASNSTKMSITSILETSSANTTRVIESLPVIPNAAQDIAKTPGMIEMVPSAGNTTQDIISVPDDSTPGNASLGKDAVLQSANITLDITSVHEMATAANTTHIIDGPPLLVNTTQDIPSLNEFKPGNTTHDIEVVPKTCLNTTQDISSVHVEANATRVIDMVSEAPTNKSQGDNSTFDAISSSPDPGLIRKSSLEVSSINEAIPTPCSSNVSNENINALESPDSPHKTQTTVNDVTQPFLNQTADVPAQESIVVDLKLPGTEGAKSEISVPSYDLNAEKRVLAVPHVSKLDSTQEINDLYQPEGPTPSDVRCVTVDGSKLVSPLAQTNLNVTEEHKAEAYEKNGSNSSTEITCSQKELHDFKDPRDQPSHSECCSMIHEEENAHDVSVFSVGSLSFVTSTPVPGLNNFQFQKNTRESVQQDPNLSIGSAFDETSNKIPVEQRKITQHRPQNGLASHDTVKIASRGSLLPASMQRSMVPPSEAVLKPSTSGIPAVRRSLALYQNTSQNLAREQAASKPAPRGIPGRGMIRPPTTRQSLPRPSLGNLKQTVEVTRGSNVTNKLVGNRFKSPKAAATILKARSTSAHSQLQAAPSSVKPPRLGASGTNGRLSMGEQHATILQDASKGETVRPPVSAGNRTGLPRPGTSSLRPALPQSQKVSPKLQKSQIQGLTIKKNPRELPTLGFRREIGSKAESVQTGRSIAKRATLALDVAKDAASVQAISPNQTVQTKAESVDEVQSLESSKEELANMQTICTELSDSRHESCQHIQECKCCHERYNKLLQENEELKRRLGQLLHTE